MNRGVELRWGGDDGAPRCDDIVKKNYVDGQELGEDVDGFEGGSERVDSDQLNPNSDASGHAY
jgi:hypothetical protein